ncbi:type II/IV secretion system family protein [Coprobacillus sp. CAG:698]|nr:type II/IV secretion system family protein [Coprobacillus sp. CAG:698]
MNLNFEILQYFVMKKIIKRKDLEFIESELERLNMTPEKYLTLKEYCTETGAYEVLADYYNIPFVEVDMLDIDENLTSMFTYEIMRRNKFIPVTVDKNGVLLIATGSILDANTLSSISLVFNGNVDYVLVPPSQIERYIDSIVAVIQTSEALVDLNNAKDEEIFKLAKSFDIASALNKDEEVINNPSVRLVDSIIREAIPFRASDIHIEPFEKVIKVRYRIDGDLQNRADIPIESYGAICARLKIMSGMNIAERRTPQDGRINMIVAGKEYDFRVSCLPTIYGEKFVIRILDKSSFNFTRYDLGFNDNENHIVDKILARPHGIVLLTGPTGSGKSTTLYAFLKEVNKPTVNIITVEDPVEYTMMGINQTQVNTKANMTFAAALRSILRQDPDIIMVGEIRDEETAQIAIRSAITGHLVFSTLHTNDAPGAIIRLEDMGVPDYLVSDALVGVIAQRLVKRLCPACKKRGKTNAKEMELLGIAEPISIFRPQGCQFCNNTGYKGRVAVHEVMYVTDELKALIVREKTLDKLRELAKEGGMVPLWNACRELVFKGHTSIQELMTMNEE